MRLPGILEKEGGLPRPWILGMRSQCCLALGLSSGDVHMVEVRCRSDWEKEVGGMPPTWTERSIGVLPCPMKSLGGWCRVSSVFEMIPSVSSLLPRSLHNLRSKGCARLLLLLLKICQHVY